MAEATTNILGDKVLFPRLDTVLKKVTIPGFKYFISVLKDTLKDIRRPYKVYSALLTQSSTDAPIVVVLENTLSGTPIWSYNGVGNYTAVLPGEFPEDKTWFSEPPKRNPEVGYSQIGWDTTDQIFVQSYAPTNDVSNDILYYTSIEIRVYE